MMQQVISDSFDFGRIALGGIWSQLWNALGQRPSQLSHFMSASVQDTDALFCVQTEGILPPGSTDGLSALDPDVFMDRPAIENLIQSCMRCIHSPSLLSLKEFYAEIQTPFLYPAIPVLKAQLLSQGECRTQLEKLAHQLVCHAPDTQAVKFGLILLSFFPGPVAIDLAKIFVAHDEFTLFALEVLRQDKGHFFDHVWELAPNVHGWGRIHLVKNLLDMPHCEKHAVRHWLVTEGYRNNVFPQLLIPWILQKVSLPDILERCQDESFEKITQLFVCCMDSKHSKLFLRSGWLTHETKRAYRLSAISRSRSPSAKRVLDWMKSN